MQSMRVYLLPVLLLMAPSLFCQQLGISGGMQQVHYHLPDFRGSSDYSHGSSSYFELLATELPFSGHEIGLALNYSKCTGSFRSISEARYVAVPPAIGAVRKEILTSWEEVGLTVYPYKIRVLKYIGVYAGIETTFVIHEESFQNVSFIQSTGEQSIAFMEGKSADIHNRFHVRASGKIAGSIPIKNSFHVMPQYQISWGLSNETDSKARSLRQIFALGFTVALHERNEPT